MTIAFESQEESLRKLRERLRKMSDEELIKFGKDVKKLSGPNQLHSRSVARTTRRGAGRVETKAPVSVTIQVSKELC